MKVLRVTLIVMLVVAALAGCGGSEATPAPADTGGSEVYTSVALDTSYENALPVSRQLALGIFQLEETENAVTPEQAKTLLPLWQAIQAGTLQSDAETNAVLKQIEGVLTSEQVEAIAAMQLTAEDERTWVQEQGISMEASPEALATRQAKGGGQGGSGPPGNMSEEDRATKRATAEAGGMNLSERGFGGVNILAQPLIELLTQRAAE